MKTPTRSQTHFCKRFLYRYFVPAERSVVFLFLYFTLSLALVLSSVYGRIHYSSGRILTARVAQQCKSPGADAVKNYNDAASSARTALEKLRTANLLVKSDADGIKADLEKVTADEAMVGQFAKVADLLEAGVVKSARFGPLKLPLADVKSKSKLLDQAYAAFKPCENETAPPDDVKKVLDNYRTLNTDIQEQQKVGDQLKTAIGTIQPKVQEFLALKLSSGSPGLAGRADKLAVLNEDPDPQTLRSALVKDLPDLAPTLSVRRLASPVTDRLSAALDPTKFTDLTGVISAKPSFSFADVDTRLKETLRKAPHWADLLVEASRQQEKNAEDAIAQAMRDPFHQGGAALTQATIADAAQKEFSTISDALRAVLTEIQRTDVPRPLAGEDLAQQTKKLSDSIPLLQTLNARLLQSIKQLNGNIPLDKSTWTMASVDLFYFDDVGRLVRVLSPNARLIGGNKTLQDNATAKRRELDQASQTLLNADAAVSDARQKVAKVEERVRLAENKVQAQSQADRDKLNKLNDAAAAADQRVIEAENRRKRLQSNQARAQDEFDDAQAAAQAAPDDATLKARRDSARRVLEATKQQVAVAQADEDSAKERATAAHGQVTAAGTSDQELADLKTELTNAKADLTKALSDREAATAAQRTAITSAFLAAQAENFAFAQARDNAPFWTNLPDTSTSGTGSGTAPSAAPDSDPISRVLLFGFPDSRTLFIRGHRDDIDLVRQIVKEFDKPAGQAMMTLRTMEISSDGTADSAKRTLKFLDEMNDELNKTQEQIDGALRHLRDAINQQVDASVTDYRVTLENDEKRLRGESDAKINISRADPHDDKKRVEANLSINDLHRTQHRKKMNPEELESIAFYDPDVMKALGWHPELIDKLADTHFLNAVIPRPGHTVTLAQALIVLSLAKAENRTAVIAKLTLPGREPGEATRVPAFSSLRRFMGTDGKSADTLAFQSRLIEALRYNGITHVLESVETLVRADLDLKQTIQLKEATRSSAQTAEASRSINDEIAELNNDRTRLNEQNIAPMVKWLQGNTPNATPEQLRKRIEAALTDDNGMSSLLAAAMGLRRSARYRFSDANESAVNLTFRKFLEQVNRDLDNVYVKPAFRRINERLLKEHLGVGVIQETSILASNRLAARVDPKGSAQLAVGEEQNILQAAQQLVNLFGIAGKGLVNGATGNPAALAGGPAGGASSILTGAQSVLNALDQMPREAPPAVYGIATGNLFQVTPVIDPSGQALRFRFDFVSATQIREPNDTINPQLPRIERHSINTEVYLSDQQIRLISQFQANSRLGVAKRRSGGFPILNQIPGIREVPLIGWFIKTGGRAAQTQQSFIFCQTAMYPTLSEVLDVSVQSPTFTGF
jgi:hypothetical protein